MIRGVPGKTIQARSRLSGGRGDGDHAAASGYVVDHTRIKLGEGESSFQAAKTGLERWDQFRLGCVEAWPSDTSMCGTTASLSLARIAS